MLVLTRRTGEEITIGDDITVVILANNGRQVRVGIDAPREIGIHRDNAFLRTPREKKLKE